MMMDKAMITKGEVRLHGEHEGFPQLKAVFGACPLRTAYQMNSVNVLRGLPVMEKECPVMRNWSSVTVTLKLVAPKWGV